ncbi:MAG TPA: DUF748 domain-containing protein, partial [Verrucomicrobiae bacterium]|nr:DUF748 domain-containing protein [Verrucomicrobiae bacterium]
MKPWKKMAAGTAGFLSLVTIFLVLVLPPVVVRHVERRVREATGRELSVRKLSVNPFTLTVRVEGVRLTERGTAATFASFSSLRIGMSPASVNRLAPVVREVALVSPAVRIERTGSNAYNFSDLLASCRSPKPTSAEPARFSVNNITIRNGSVDFIDAGPAGTRLHTVRDLRLAVPFVSNIPYLAERYVQPHFSAVINGAPFSREGKLKPFADAAEYTVSVDLRRIDLPFYAGYLPSTLPVTLCSGTLDARCDISHRAVAHGKPVLTAAGSAWLRGLAVADPRRNPLLRLDLLEAAVKRADLIGREVEVEKVLLKGPEVFLRRNADGSLWLPGSRNPADKAPDGTKTAPARVTLAALRLEGGQVHVVDRVPAGGFAADLRDVAFSLDDFTTFAGGKGTFAASALSARGERVAARGDLAMEPLRASCSVQAAGLVMEAYYPYLQEQLVSPVQGRLDFSGDILWEAGKGVSLDRADLKLRSLAAKYGSGEESRAALLAISGGKIDPARRTAVLGEVMLRDAALQLSRDAEGGLSPLTLLRTPAPPRDQAAAGEAAPPFNWRIGKLSGSGVAVRFTDGMKEEQPEFRLQDISFSISGLSGPRMQPLPFRFDSRYGERGRVSATGTLTPAPQALKGHCRLGGIPLADFEPYLPETVDVVLADGALDLDASFDLKKEGEVSGTFGGTVGVRSFHCMDGDGGDDLLRWESLQLEGIQGNLKPFSVAVGDVALNRFFARVVLDADGTLNLRRATASPAPSPAAVEVKGAALTAQPAPAAPQAAGAPGGDRRMISVDRVTIQEGAVYFTDRQTKPEYTARLVNLGGRISGLSSQENVYADLDLRGNLDNQSPLRMTGRINPLRDDLFVDLKASFTDIELSPVTPYSGTYAGYAIERGKLFLDLKYLVDKKKLSAENHVFIDQFTFGRAVESDKATKLPVRLAVALLKDRRGEIHLDLPLSGRTDDPEFSVWSVVLQMLKNLLVKAATSPFALLQSAFGGKDDFSSVAFEPGTARLPAPEKEKLVKLAALLGDRPGVKLEVSAFVERDRDSEAFRQELLLKRMKGEKFLALVKERKNSQGQTAEG